MMYHFCYCAVCSVVCCVDCFFFFKQKTAYEMRISDWSSDVCSSDLLAALTGARNIWKPAEAMPIAQPASEGLEINRAYHLKKGLKIGRASCRERCVSTCRSRWSPYH